MQREGMSFDRYIVTDSLCCPSRASILTGRYPHSTGVRTNVLPFGGFDVFHITEEWSTIATSLQAVGYRTALMGKYLNGYAPRKIVDGRRNFVPPGWSEWAGVPTGGDPDFNYTMLVKGLSAPAQTVRYGNRPSAYLTDVLSRRGRNFIAGAVKAGQPFMLKLSPYAPHYPYTPAPRDAQRFPDLQAPRGELFDAPQLEGSPVVADAAPARALADRRHRRGLPQARPVGRGDRPHDRRRPRAAAPARRRAQHVHRLHVRQRLPHRPAAHAARQADLLGSRRPGPAGRRRAGRARPARRSPGSPRTSTCARRSRSSRGRRSARASRAAAWRRSCAARRRRAGAASRSSSTAARTGPTTTRTRSAPARATRRATPRCASRTRSTSSTTTRRSRPSTTTTRATRSSSATCTAHSRRSARPSWLRSSPGCASAAAARPVRPPTRRVSPMRAIQIVELSGPEALKLAELPEPDGDGVVVEVRAAGVSFPEVLQSRGLYQVKPDLPFVPGSEVAGDRAAGAGGRRGQRGRPRRGVLHARRLRRGRARAAAVRVPAARASSTSRRAPG